MKRLLFVPVALALLAATAFADVTVTSSITVQGVQSASGTSTTYAKGAKLRADTSVAGQSISVLSDAAAKQQWMINHATKTIEPFNPGQATAALPITFGEPKVSVTANGQTKEILGRACQGFTVDISIPLTIGGESVTMKMSGPSWVAKDGVGVAEYREAQKLLSQSGISTSPLAQGPQGKAMVEAMKALADAGMVLEQELKVTVEGTGQLAQVLGQQSAATVITKVTAISTDAIPDSTFALPDGYTRK